MHTLGCPPRGMSYESQLYVLFRVKCKTYVLNEKDYKYHCWNSSSQLRTSKNSPLNQTTQQFYCWMHGYCLNHWSRNSKQLAGTNCDINFSPVCNIDRRMNLPEFHILNYASINLAKCLAMRAIDLQLCIPPCLSMTINPSLFCVLWPS